MPTAERNPEASRSEDLLSFVFVRIKQSEPPVAIGGTLIFAKRGGPVASFQGRSIRVIVNFRLSLGVTIHQARRFAEVLLSCIEIAGHHFQFAHRSEERRVGEEGRSRWAPAH